MLNKPLLILCACCLCAFAAAPPKACANGTPAETGRTNGAGRQQAAPLGFELARGAVRLVRGADPVFSNARLRLRFADNSSVTGDFEAAARTAGSDGAGRFDVWRYGFKPAAAPPPPAPPVKVPDFKAALELRRYHGS
ncbi:MAG TPA: hypothetical protein VE360_01345, partial [Pyrinomonadaceae bacterium]|nr:hypothetical protein [Pyrinomonadaceae bacterium]